MSLEKRQKPVHVDLPASGLRVFHSSHGREFSMESSRHTYFEIILVEWGKGRLIFEGGETLLAAGEMVVTSPGFAHRFVDDEKEPLSLLVLCVDPGTAKTFPPFAELMARFEGILLNGFHFPVPGPFRENRFRELYRSLLFVESQRSSFMSQRQWSLASEIMILLIEGVAEIGSGSITTNETSSQSILLERCEAHLKTHFLEPLRIRDLALLTSLSYRRFTHLFKKKTGKTVHDYLEELRIQYSKSQLLKTGNIVHSALHSGFEDLSTFYRAFKKRTRQTPKKFLETAGK